MALGRPRPPPVGRDEILPGRSVREGGLAVRRGLFRAAALLAPFVLLGGCSAPAAPAAQGVARPVPKGRIVGRPQPVRVTSRILAQLLGRPPSAWVIVHLAMASPEVGWAAGAGPGGGSGYFALATRNGGHSFSLLFKAPKPIVSVSAPDPSHAFFLEQSCINGGGCESELQEWSPGTAGPATLWRSASDMAPSASFPTAKDGYVAAVDSLAPSARLTLYATHDGGAQFAALALPCADAFSALIAFRSAMDGWLVCPGTIAAAGRADAPMTQEKDLYATHDGGRHWARVSRTGTSGAKGGLPGAGIADALFLQSAKQGYLGLDGGGVYETRDAGRTWRRAFPGLATDRDSVTGLGFLPDGSGWILGAPGPRLAVTSDGGRTWRVAWRATPAPQAGLADLGGGRALALGVAQAGLWQSAPPELITSANGGQDWLPARALPESVMALQALSRRDLVALVHRGLQSGVAASRDLGRHWRRLWLPRAWQAWSLGFLDPDRGWLVATHENATFGLFACAQACTPLRTPFSPAYAQMTGDTAGFAVGTDALGRTALFTTSDGGLHWREALLTGQAYSAGGTRGAVRWLYGQSYDPMAALPYGAVTVLKSDTGGRSWQAITLPAGDQGVLALSFSSAEDGLLLTESPITGIACWRTDDGGRTFHLLRAGPPPP